MAFTFPQRIRQRRKELGLSQSELRRRASVQNQIVSGLEDQKRAAKLKSDLASKKEGAQVKTLLSVAKVCGVLGLPWEEVITELQSHLDADRRVSMNTIRDGLQVARTGTVDAWWSLVESKLNDRRESSRSKRDVQKVRVAMLDWEPFCWRGREGLIDRNSFFYQFCSLLLFVLDPSLRADPIVIDSFDRIHWEMSAGPMSEMGFPLAIGILPTQTRRELYDVDFVRIPGLRVRLCCIKLSKDESKISWPMVWKAFESPEEARVRVVTARGAVAQMLHRPVEAADSLNGGPIVYCPSLDADRMAGTFERECAAFEESGCRTASPVLVADETTSALVVRNMHRRKLVEADRNAGVSFDLSLAVPKSEPRWKQRIEAALADAVFSGFAVNAADAYASIVQRAMSDQIIWRTRTDKPSSKKRALHSYLRLQEFPDNVHVGDRFFRHFAMKSRPFLNEASPVRLLPYSRRREKRLRGVLRLARKISEEVKQINEKLADLDRSLNAVLNLRRM